MSSHSSVLSFSHDVAHQDQRQPKALVVDPSTTVRKMVMKIVLLKLGILSDDSDGANERVFNAVRKSMIEVKSGNMSATYDMLILSHVMKGDSSGRDTTRHLRQLGYEGLIILVFGDLTIDDAVNFRECGADAAISKPVTADKLLACLHGEQSLTLVNIL